MYVNKSHQYFFYTNQKWIKSTHRLLAISCYNAMVKCIVIQFGYASITLLIR